MVTQWTLVRGGTLLDGTGTPARQGSVLIKGNRIDAVGPEVTERDIPRGVGRQTIDATGKTIMPGLIDAHCHMSYGESHAQEEQDLYTSRERRTLIAAANCAKVLRAGVTSISQPGGSYYIGVGLRDGIRDELVQGPRMTAAGRYITTSNGLTDWYPDEVGVPDGSIGTLANTLGEMTAEVRRQVKNGVDLIKLADSPYGDYQAFTGDELKGIVDLAHQLGRRVTIHARGPAEVNASVAAGMDWIMHGNIMTDDIIERLAESRIPLVPTLLLLANFAEWGHLVGSPARARDACKRMLDTTADTLHRAHKAGVIMAVGTDTGFAMTPYGEWHARELELLMTYAGMSPMEAIVAGTRNGARMVGLEGEVGELTPGALADLIVVDGDPLADIRVLQDRRNINVVIKDGKRITFDEERLEKRWHHNRARIYSTENLTQDVIRGHREPIPIPPGEGIRETETPQQVPELPWEPAEGREIARDLGERERAAKNPDD